MNPFRHLMLTPFEHFLERSGGDRLVGRLLRLENTGIQQGGIIVGALTDGIKAFRSYREYQPTSPHTRRSCYLLPGRHLARPP